MSANSRVGPDTIEFKSGVVDTVKATATASRLTLSGPAASAVLLSNVADPTGAQDAATKNYVDNSGGGGGGGGWGPAGASGTFQYNSGGAFGPVGTLTTSDAVNIDLSGGDLNIGDGDVIGFGAGPEGTIGATGSDVALVGLGGDLNVASSSGEVTVDGAAGVVISSAAGGIGLVAGTGNVLVETTGAATQQFKLGTSDETAVWSVTDSAGSDVLAVSGSGDATVERDLVVGGAVFQNGAVTQVAWTGSLTLPLASFITGYFIHAAASTDITDTTPTAAEIVGAIKDVEVGSSFDFTLVNEPITTQTIEVTGGAGVSVYGGMKYVGPNRRFTWRVVVTNVVSPAVTMYAKTSPSRCVAQGNCANALNNGSNGTTYIAWGTTPNSLSFVDSLQLGNSGVVRTITMSWSYSLSMVFGVGEEVRFDLGTVSLTPTPVFVPVSNDAVIWTRDNANGIWPVTTSNVLNYRFTADTKLAVRIREIGDVAHTGGEIQCQMVVDLD